MIFKNNTIKEEWLKLNLDVKVIMRSVECFLASKKLQTKVTCIFRSVEDNINLYNLMKKPVIPSLHSYYHAVDFTIVDEKLEHVNADIYAQDILEYINSRFPYGNGLHKTIIYHDGTAMHFHIQVSML